jgi:hypothetical protein
MHGAVADGASFYERAKTLDSAWIRMTAGAAWALATSPEDRERNPPAALRLARQLNEAGPVTASTLDILAAAYAENGDFEAAGRQARRALDLLAPTAKEERSQAQAHFDSYQAHRPWRQLRRAQREMQRPP